MKSTIIGTLMIIFAVGVSTVVGNLAFAQTEDDKEKRHSPSMTEEEIQAMKGKKMMKEIRDDESDDGQMKSKKMKSMSEEEMEEIRDNESDDGQYSKDIGSDGNSIKAKKMKDMTEEEVKALKVKYEQSKKERGIDEISNSLSESELDELQDRYQTMTATQKNSLEFKEASLTPIQQQVIDVEPEEVVCKDGLQLIIRTATGQPACVKPNTAINMVERGVAILG